MPTGDAVDVLRFWRDVEIFDIPKPPTPTWSRGGTFGGNQRVERLDEHRALPWDLSRQHELEGKPGYEWRHTVFLGCAPAQDFAALVLAAAASSGLQSDTPSLSIGDLEQIRGDGYLANFNVDERGRIAPDSFVLASWPVGVWRLRKRRSLDDLTEELERLQEDFMGRHPSPSASTDERVATTQAPHPPGAVASNDEPRPKSPVDDAFFGDVADAGFEDAHVEPAVPPHPSEVEPADLVCKWDDLRNEFERVITLLGRPARGMPLKITVKSQRRRCRDDGEETRDEVDLLNSFYLDDLDALIAKHTKRTKLGSALRAYLGMDAPPLARVDILTDRAALMARLHPKRLTLGRWPSRAKHPLVVAQQVAVGEIFARLGEGAGLVAVNGPPGTGKTTLLRDVVAEVVVRRAKRLAALSAPSQAFDARKTIGGASFSPIKRAIVGSTGMVVTSNNNAAVENITRELPQREQIAGDEHPDAEYFAPVATALARARRNDADMWGLVAATLGKKANRQQFAHAFYDGKRVGDELYPGIHTLLENGVPPDWHKAKADFVELCREVETEVAKRVAVAEGDERAGAWRAERARRAARRDTLLAELERFNPSPPQAADLEHSARQARLRLAGLEAEREAACIDYDDADGAVREAQAHRGGGTWDKIAGWFGFSTASRKRLEEALRVEYRGLVAAKDRISAIDRQAETLLAELAAVQRASDRQAAAWSARRDALAAEVDAETAALSDIEAHLAGHDHWGTELRSQDVCAASELPNDPSEWHLKSVWTCPKLEHLRAALFLAALRLHAATLYACPGKALGNLRVVKQMLTGDTKEPIREVDLPAVWDMLFFLVPVVSTTLASFDRLFSGLGAETIGWLLVDEAGQATPQSLTGALYRSKRAVIVGDPLQVQPVVTVPQALIEDLRRRRNVSEAWSPALQSAQTLADRAMEVGAQIDLGNDDPVWTGLPLRAHRRCHEPMFSIANKIAYAGQMVARVKGRFDGQTGPRNSCWVSVQGRQHDKQVVQREMDVLAAIIEVLWEEGWPERDGKRSTMYVISPFRAVASKAGETAMRVLGRLGAPKNLIEAGTVHRFQGKEADVVVLVLGSPPGPAGQGTRKWAAQAPNLLNVAVTRARLRLYVIGNLADWCELPYFETADRELRRFRGPRNGEEVLQQAAALGQPGLGPPARGAAPTGAARPARLDRTRR